MGYNKEYKRKVKSGKKYDKGYDNNKKSHFKLETKEEDIPRRINKSQKRSHRELEIERFLDEKKLRESFRSRSDSRIEQETFDDILKSFNKRY